ncbi:FAR1-RELATED SEQUENCE 11 [Spatholobus suberectus]|nr:FAR1-RELATED SEQUENCE 11 [Spatholobus suberectus]
MTTTGYSESMNTYIKRFLGVKTSLTNFVNLVGVAIKIRNQAREEARMLQKYHNPQIRTGFPIEEHVASILTSYAFKLLQHEIDLSTKYAAIETSNGSYIVQNHSRIDEEAQSLKAKDREQVATKELVKVIQMIKCMPKSQENLIDMEHDVSNNDGCDVQNPIVSKTKGRSKGGVEVAKKSTYCHFPNCGGTNHDPQNCPNKKKNIEALSSQSPNK